VTTIVWEALAKHSIHGSIRKLKGAKHCPTYIKRTREEKKKEKIYALIVSSDGESNDF
jgi:hypothetical protein